MIQGKKSGKEQQHSKQSKKDAARSNQQQLQSLQAMRQTSLKDQLLANIRRKSIIEQQQQQQQNGSTPINLKSSGINSAERLKEKDSKNNNIAVATKQSSEQKIINIAVDPATSSFARVAYKRNKKTEKKSISQQHLQSATKSDNQTKTSQPKTTKVQKYRPPCLTTKGNQDLQQKSKPNQKKDLQQQSPWSKQSGDIFTLDSFLRRDMGSILVEGEQEGEAPVTPGTRNVIRNHNNINNNQFQFKSLYASTEQLQDSATQNRIREKSISLANTPNIEIYENTIEDPQHQRSHSKSSTYEILNALQEKTEASNMKEKKAQFVFQSPKNGQNVYEQGLTGSKQTESSQDNNFMEALTFAMKELQDVKAKKQQIDEERCLKKSPSHSGSKQNSKSKRTYLTVKPQLFKPTSSVMSHKTIHIDNQKSGASNSFVLQIDSKKIQKKQIQNPLNEDLANLRSERNHHNKSRQRVSSAQNNSKDIDRPLNQEVLVQMNQTAAQKMKQKKLKPISGRNHFKSALVPNERNQKVTDFLQTVQSLQSQTSFTSQNGHDNELMRNYFDMKKQHTQEDSEERIDSNATRQTVLSKMPSKQMQQPGQRQDLVRKQLSRKSTSQKTTSSLGMAYLQNTNSRQFLGSGGQVQQHHQRKCSVEISVKRSASNKNNASTFKKGQIHMHQSTFQHPGLTKKSINVPFQKAILTNESSQNNKYEGGKQTQSMVQSAKLTQLASALSGEKGQYLARKHSSGFSEITDMNIQRQKYQSAAQLMETNDDLLTSDQNLKCRPPTTSIKLAHQLELDRKQSSSAYKNSMEQQRDTLMTVPIWKQKIQLVASQKQSGHEFNKKGTSSSSPFLLGLNDKKLTSFQKIKAFQKTRRLIIDQGIQTKAVQLNHKMSTQMAIRPNTCTNSRNQQSNGAAAILNPRVLVKEMPFNVKKLDCRKLSLDVTKKKTSSRMIAKQVDNGGANSNIFVNNMRLGLQKDQKSKSLPQLKEIDTLIKQSQQNGANEIQTRDKVDGQKKLLHNRPDLSVQTSEEPEDSKLQNNKVMKQKGTTAKGCVQIQLNHIDNIELSLDSSPQISHLFEPVTGMSTHRNGGYPDLSASEMFQQQNIEKQIDRSQDASELLDSIDQKRDKEDEHLKSDADGNQFLRKWCPAERPDDIVQEVFEEETSMIGNHQGSFSKISSLRKQKRVPMAENNQSIRKNYQQKIDRTKDSAGQAQKVPLQMKASTIKMTRNTLKLVSKKSTKHTRAPFTSIKKLTIAKCTALHQPASHQQPLKSRNQLYSQSQNNLSRSIPTTLQQSPTTGLNRLGLSKYYARDGTMQFERKESKQQTFLVSVPQKLLSPRQGKESHQATRQQTQEVISNQKKLQLLQKSDLSTNNQKAIQQQRVTSRKSIDNMQQQFAENNPSLYQQNFQAPVAVKTVTAAETLADDSPMYTGVTNSNKKKHQKLIVPKLVKRGGSTMQVDCCIDSDQVQLNLGQKLLTKVILNSSQSSESKASQYRQVINQNQWSQQKKTKIPEHFGLVGNQIQLSPKEDSSRFEDQQQQQQQQQQQLIVENNESARRAGTVTSEQGVQAIDFSQSTDHEQQNDNWQLTDASCQIGGENLRNSFSYKKGEDDRYQF